jgi:hypothetical protein
MSFFSKIESFFERLGSGTFEQKIMAGATVCAQLLETTVGLAKGTTAEAAVTNIANQAQADFAAVSAFASAATTGGTTKPTVTSILTSTQQNIGSLLTAADVKNSSKATEITSATNTIIGEIEAILKSV